MSWNYRILKKKNQLNQPYFEVCEVYYNSNNKPNSWAESHNLLCFDELDDLKDAYEKIQDAFGKPVLEIVDNKLIELKE